MDYLGEMAPEILYQALEETYLCIDESAPGRQDIYMSILASAMFFMSELPGTYFKFGPHDPTPKITANSLSIFLNYNAQGPFFLIGHNDAETWGGAEEFIIESDEFEATDIFRHYVTNQHGQAARAFRSLRQISAREISRSLGATPTSGFRRNGRRTSPGNASNRI